MAMTRNVMGGGKHARTGLSRRAVLAGGASLAAVAIAGRASLALEEPKVPPSAWAELRRRLNGPLLRPEDSGFAEVAKPFNLVFANRLPAGIARCRNEADIATALRWCRENGVPLAARGGGHNYAGYSTTKGLLIETSGLRQFRFDRENGRLTVGAGLKNGDVRMSLGELGAGIVHGRCSNVGIAGFLLGGGVGFNMRRNGVGSDLLVSSRMVDAAGEVRTLSADENQDLFWACRGGAGGNFGINTSFELATFPVSEVTVFHLRWQENTEETLATLLTVLDRGPNALGARVAVAAPRPGRNEGPLIDLLGHMFATRDEVLDLLGPALRVAPTSMELIETLPYWKGQDVLAEHSAHDYYRERSRFVREPLSDKALATVFDFIGRYPGQNGSGMFKLFQTGGAMNAVPAADTAFVHRDSRWLLTVANVWAEQEEPARVNAASEWMDAFYAAMLPYCGEGAFQNFPDPDLSDWAQQYYGANLPRLQRVKAQVDPDNLFRFPQSIRPA